MSAKPTSDQFDKGNCVPSQPHLFWWTCRLCGTSTAGEGPPTNHVCSNPNGCKVAPADAGDAVRVVEALEKIVYAADAYNQEAAVETAKEEATAALAAARRLLDAPPGVGERMPVDVFLSLIETHCRMLGEPETDETEVARAIVACVKRARAPAEAGSVATGEGGT